MNPHKTRSQFDGDVQKLFVIRPLSPIGDFPFVLQFLTEHIQFLGHGWYLLTGSRPFINDGISDDTIRACMLLWAADDSAAILASRCEDSLDRKKCQEHELPLVQHFAPTSTGWTYGEILKSGCGQLMESAVYGSNGEFQFKELRLKNSHLYYRSRTRKASEPPFAISLTGIRNR